MSAKKSAGKQQQIFQFGQKQVVLNQEQHTIVHSQLNQHQKIIACAGSGKTTTIICRIKILIDQGIDPEKIWMTAFNIDAAQEIKDRLQQLIGPKSEKIKVNNIDKISKMLLCKYQPGFSSKINQQQQQLELEENQDITTSEFKRKGYFQIKDFTPELVKLLKNHTNLIKENFQYFFFDEFQDINPEEYEFLKLLAQNKVSLTVIGDDAQNIYSFRDAQIDIIQTQINREIKPIQTYTLSTNYRSSPEIVNFANEIVKNSDILIKKQMLPNKFSQDQKIKLKQYPNQETQNSQLLQEIIHKIYSENLNPEKIAILCRNNKPLQSLQDHISQHNKKPNNPRPINILQNFQNENNTQNNLNQKSKTQKNPKKKPQQQQNSILKFMQNSSTNQHLDKSITLSTIHRSKGLEWDLVYIINCNDEYIPGSGNQEEDRRVFYVAVTRAKYLLNISYFNNQHVNKLTRFITQLPEKYFEGDYQQNNQLQNNLDIENLNSRKNKEKTYELQDLSNHLFQNFQNYQQKLTEILLINYNHPINLIKPSQLHLQNQNSINIQFESIHLPSKFGSWVVENNLQNEFSKFYSKFLQKSIIQKLVSLNILDSKNLTDQKAEKILNRENPPKNHKILEKSFRILQETDREPLKCLDHVYNMHICDNIYQNKLGLVERTDVYEKFSLSFNIFKNSQRHFIEKYLVNNIINQNQNNNNNVIIDQIPKEISNINMQPSIIINNFFIQFFLSENQSLKKEYIIQSLLNISNLQNQNNNNTNNIDTLLFYNPIKGIVFKYILSETQLNNTQKIQEFLQSILKDMKDLENNKQQQPEQSLQQQNNNNSFHRFEGLSDFENNNNSQDISNNSFKSSNQLQQQQQQSQGFQSANQLRLSQQFSSQQQSQGFQTANQFKQSQQKKQVQSQQSSGFQSASQLLQNQNQKGQKNNNYNNNNKQQNQFQQKKQTKINFFQIKK